MCSHLRQVLQVVVGAPLSSVQAWSLEEADIEPLFSDLLPLLARFYSEHAKYISIFAKDLQGLKQPISGDVVSHGFWPIRQRSICVHHSMMNYDLRVASRVSAKYVPVSVEASVSAAAAMF